MTASRDPDRLIRAFLLEGEDQLHDQVYDAVRAEIEQKRQRAGFGPWRTPFMNKFVAIGLGVAAVLVALVVGSQLVGPPNVIGPPTETTSPTATPEATLEPTPVPPPPLTQTFTSTQHGISVSYPEGWTAQAATLPWTESTFPLEFPVPQVDWLYDPDLTSDLFLAIASQPIGDSTSEDWVAGQMASEEGCSATEPIALDGGAGLIGCTLAVVTTADRGYWIQLYTGSEAPLGYDRAWFDQVLATVQLQPENAVD